MNTQTLIEQINLIIRGWGRYYCRANAGTLFNRLNRWIQRRIGSHRYKRWRNHGWKKLPLSVLYGQMGLVNLVELPSLGLREKRALVKAGCGKTVRPVCAADGGQPYGRLLRPDRGVGRVMPAESRFTRHSKGLALIRKDEVRHSPITELEITMETLQRLITDIAIKHSMYAAIEVSINEEPYEGNLKVRFCEGHESPYTEFIKTQSLLN